MDEDIQNLLNSRGGHPPCEYAKWGENATRAPGVRYAIQHSGGSTDITVNQQQPSGGWAHLGSYVMAPGQNHGVEVYGALEGETVGDALRFVTAGVSAPGIHYVHADHLGSPQKMTDSTKALVWDAVYTPYGRAHAITGTGVNNQRFPGQYADAETGYHYNYFRDYDPTTGRYVQSDPIGLKGGYNTYAYVGGNPYYWVDPMGLAFIEIPVPAAPPWLPEWVKAGGARIFGILGLILSVPGDTPTGGLTDLAGEKEREYQEYKSRCTERPPPGLNDCEKAKWKLKRNQDCKRLREAWDRKWQPGRHQQNIDELDRAIQNLQDWISKHCPNC